MPTDATEGPQSLLAHPADAPTRAPGTGNGSLHGHRHHFHGRRLHSQRAPTWRDPSMLDISRSKLAALASGFSLALMVVGSLALVSIASARAGILVPASNPNKPSEYPSWIAGPTGALTSWFTASEHDQRVVFTVVVAAMLVAYVVVAFCAPRLRRSWVFAAIIALHVIYFLSPPLNLTDVFNYLNYGRMEVVHHLNPYVTIPALEPHNDPTFALSNWHGLLSPYGPLFTLFTMALVPLGVAGSLWAIKAALMLASLGTVFLVYRCAEMLGRNGLTAAVIVGINPIVMVWGLGGDHNDFLMVFLLVLAFWLLLRADAMRVGKYARPRPPGARSPLLMARAWAWLDGMPRPLVAGEPAAWMEVGAGAAMIAAVAIKASAAVLIPVILAGASRRIRVAMGMVIGLAAVAAATYVAFGVNLPNVSQQDQLVVPDGIPNLTGLALGFGGATSEMRTVLKLLLVLVVLGATIWTWRTRRWRSGCGWVTMALVLTLTWTLPWYILWLLPFAALARPRGLRVAVALIAVYTYLVFMPYSSEVLGFLHVNPANTNLGQQEQAYMNSLLF